MLVLNDAQAIVVRTLLTKMLINDTYSVSQLEEAIGWFEREDGCSAVSPFGGNRVSCPFEQVWSKNLAQEIVRELRNQT
ncbi:hypothetical protein [Leptolyngbya ohadii]|uniref:hypothetical protein n=1 Tax=Leptolyngbya ohadii TaxID=1962290 RepID=UPI000B5994C9|nr:hypothetical protein [Leptolyngbya ohadii]